MKKKKQYWNIKIIIDIRFVNLEEKESNENLKIHSFEILLSFL